MAWRSISGARRFASVTQAVCAAAAILAASPAAADNHNRYVRVVNNTGVELTHLWASNVDDPSYRKDWLGRSTLASGRSIVINFDTGDGYCRFDFKAVFDDGDEVFTNSFDVCSEPRLAYRNR